MSCSIPRLISYYSDKVNIYNSDCFVKLPSYRTCPPPSMLYLTPTEVCHGPCGPTVVPIPQPLFPPGTFCRTGCEPCGPCGTSQTACGPCGTSQTACGPCGTSQTACGPCGTVQSGCGPCGTVQSGCGPCGQR